MAREIRADPRPHFGAWGCVGLLLPIALIVVAAGTTEHEKPGLLSGIGVLGVFGWFAYQFGQHCKPYRCPECGDGLKEKLKISKRTAEDREDWGSIHYVCHRCDIEWDTGNVWSDRGD